jgi:hypothetical protein
MRFEQGTKNGTRTHDYWDGRGQGKELFIDLRYLQLSIT